MTWSGYSERGQGSQERGPGSFANDAPRPVIGQASDAAGSAQVRGGVRFVGSGTSDVGRVRPGSLDLPTQVSTKDGTLELLMQLGEKTLAPRIAEMKQQAEVEGAARHASGVALEEIVNEQPWYANVFGTAPAVEGARAYAARSATARFVQSNLENMEALAPKSPEEIGPLLSQQMEQFLTGDPAADSMIKNELLAQAPTLVKAHTKAHVAYMQKKADAAHRSALTSTAEHYGAAMAEPDLLTAEDRERVELSLAETFMLPEGRNPDSHWKNITDVLIEQANKGNAHFVAAATRAGMLDAIPPDYRDMVKTGIMKAAPGVFARAVERDVDLLTASVALRTNPPETPAEIKAEWERINEIVAQRTGIPTGLVKFHGLDDLAASVNVDMRRDMQEQAEEERATAAEAKRQIAAAQKEQDKALRMTQYTAALTRDFNDPRVNLEVASKNLRDTFDLTKEEENEVWRGLMNGQDAAGVGRLLRRMPIASNDAIKERLTTWTDAAKRPQDKDAWAGAWAQLVQVSSEVPDEAILATHMGQEQAADVKRVQQMVATGVDMLTAITVVTQEGPARRAAAKWRAGATDEKQKDARELVSEVVADSIGKSDSFRNWRTMFGGRKPDPQQIEMLSGILANLDTGLLSSPKASMKVALNGLQADGRLTLAGGGVVLNIDARDELALPLHKAVGLQGGHKDAVHEALLVVAEEKLRAEGYGMTRGALSHAADVITRITSPIQSAGVLGQIPKDTGFEGTGYTVVRMPRAAGSNKIVYAVTYERDGKPRQLMVDSEEVRMRYSKLIGGGRAAAAVQATDDEVTNSVIQQNLK